jgi:hypothetical protein
MGDRVPFDVPDSAIPARELVFHFGPVEVYGGIGITLSERRSVAKITPPSSEDDIAEFAGAYLDLLDSEGALRYRARLKQPLPVEIETFGTSGQFEPFTYSQVPTGRFSCFVPDLPAIETVVLRLSFVDAPAVMRPQLGLDDGDGTKLVGSWPWEAPGLV